MVAKAKYTTKIKKAMKAMGTYEQVYDMTIGMLAQLMEQYDVLNAKYLEAGMPYFEHTQAGKKKSPIVTTLESLRHDILSYQTALGLTPNGAKSLDIKKTSGGPSKLEKALMAAGDSD